MKKTKKILLLGLTIFFPWLMVLLEDKPGIAILTLVLQVTVIGWPFAIIWAWGIVKESEKLQSTKSQGSA